MNDGENAFVDEATLVGKINCLSSLLPARPIIFPGKKSPHFHEMTRTRRVFHESRLSCFLEVLELRLDKSCDDSSQLGEHKVSLLANKSLSKHKFCGFKDDTLLLNAGS